MSDTILEYHSDPFGGNHVLSSRDVLAMPQDDDDDSEAGSGAELRAPEHISVMSR